MGTIDVLRQSLEASARTLEAFLEDDANLVSVERFADRAYAVLSRGGRLLACGNGGSMSDAMHFAAEWSGRFRDDRPGLPAIALSDPAAMSSIANDYGYDEVFARQVEAQGRAGDLLVALSTSGQSENVLRAVDSARAAGLLTVALTGRTGGKLASRVDVPIVVPLAETADRIQEVHIQILHAVILAVEQRVFPSTR